MSQQAIDRTVLPIRRPPFAGVNAHADTVAKALKNAVRSSTAQIDKASAKELKAGLEEAGAGLGG